jgi:uncharacterized protein with von Willebrand factor type A (vWA) domain
MSPITAEQLRLPCDMNIVAAHCHVDPASLAETLRGLADLIEFGQGFGDMWRYPHPKELEKFDDAISAIIVGDHALGLDGPWNP